MVCPYCRKAIEIVKAHDVRKLSTTPDGKKLCHTRCLKLHQKSADSRCSDGR